MFSDKRFPKMRKEAVKIHLIRVISVLIFLQKRCVHTMGLRRNGINLKKDKF